MRLAREKLADALVEIQSKDYAVNNPVTNVVGRIKLEQNATSVEKLLLSRFESIESRLRSLEQDGTPLLRRREFFVTLHTNAERRDLAFSAIQGSMRKIDPRIKIEMAPYSDRNLVTVELPFEATEDLVSGVRQILRSTKGVIQVS